MKYLSHSSSLYYVYVYKCSLWMANVFLLVCMFFETWYKKWQCLPLGRTADEGVTASQPKHRWYLCFSAGPCSGSSWTSNGGAALSWDPNLLFVVECFLFLSNIPDLKCIDYCIWRSGDYQTWLGITWPSCGRGWWAHELACSQVL